CHVRKGFTVNTLWPSACSAARARCSYRDNVWSIAGRNGVLRQSSCLSRAGPSRVGRRSPIRCRQADSNQAAKISWGIAGGLIFRIAHVEHVAHFRIERIARSMASRAQLGHDDRTVIARLAVVLPDEMLGKRPAVLELSLEVG